ncbi:hypothetical protein D3C76_780690 [compost metagenome]
MIQNFLSPSGRQALECLHQLLPVIRRRFTQRLQFVLERSAGEGWIPSAQLDALMDVQQPRRRGCIFQAQAPQLSKLNAGNFEH